MEGTFHRRVLPPPSIAFSSPDGKLTFLRALSGNYMACYFIMSEQHVTQGHPAFCGIGSLTMALNSLLVDPKRVWQGVWRWFDESMLDCCESHEIVKLKGITLAKLACLARCNGADTDLIFGSNITVEVFRNDVKKICKQEDSKKVMIVSYSRKALFQTGDGHFSPIGGYDEEGDLVLILDVARFKYPPHWVPLTNLFEGLCAVDNDSGCSRGYLLLGCGPELDRQCSCLCSDSSPLPGVLDPTSNPNTTSNPVCSPDGATSLATNDVTTTSTDAPSNLSNFLNHECSCCCNGKPC